MVMPTYAQDNSAAPCTLNSVTVGFPNAKLEPLKLLKIDKSETTQVTTKSASDWLTTRKPKTKAKADPQPKGKRRKTLTKSDDTESTFVTETCAGESLNDSQEAAQKQKLASREGSGVTDVSSNQKVSPR